MNAPDPGRLTIAGFNAEQQAKRARMVKEVTKEVLKHMERQSRRRPSRWDRFCTWVAFG